MGGLLTPSLTVNSDLCSYPQFHGAMLNYSSKCTAQWSCNYYRHFGRGLGLSSI